MKNATANKLFLFGGCYSNLQAATCIKEIATELGFGSQQIICTGDAVGYCAQPEETVQLIKDWGIRVIAGNVEIQLRDGEMDCGCNFVEGSRCNTFSTKWFPYAQNQLSQRSIDWMHNLPTHLHFEKNGKQFHVIHGGTDNVSEFIFESTPIERKLEIFEQTKSDVIIAGHSGLPFVQHIPTDNGQEKVWFNPGVIGMPANDGTPRCWYGIINLETFDFELKPFNYDHNLASQLMMQHELPKEYAKTLVTGIWDNCEILPERETARQGISL